MERDMLPVVISRVSRGQPYRESTLEMRLE